MPDLPFVDQPSSAPYVIARPEKPKLLFLITEDWFFCRHFLPMARAAREAGFDVVVATRVAACANAIAAEGVRTISLDWQRGRWSPLQIFGQFARIRKILRAEQPDVVHCIALPMVLLGGLAGRLAPVNSMVLAPTGLGHLWISNGLFEKFARSAIRFVVAHWLNGPRICYLFENTDDPLELRLGPRGAPVRFVAGAGVDPVKFPLAPEPPAPPVKVAVVARMLKTKGIAESVAAVSRARTLGAPVELHLFGEPDPSNPSSLTEATLQALAAQPGVFWHGPSTDPAQVWCQHHIAMLLSYREGLPKSLVEAAATGRPLIATNVTGCRELVRDGVEGFLISRGDIEATANALVRAATDPSLRRRMGAAAHARFNERFTEQAVMTAMQALYRQLAAQV